jgi:hypothetical protein
VDAPAVGSSNSTRGRYRRLHLTACSLCYFRFEESARRIDRASWVNDSAMPLCWGEDSAKDRRSQGRAAHHTAKDRPTSGSKHLATLAKNPSVTYAGD